MAETIVPWCLQLGRATANAQVGAPSGPRPRCGTVPPQCYTAAGHGHRPQPARPSSGFRATALLAGHGGRRISSQLQLPLSAEGYLRAWPERHRHCSRELRIRACALFPVQARYRYSIFQSAHYTCVRIERINTVLIIRQVLIATGASCTIDRS